MVSRLEVFDELPQVTTLVNNFLVGKSVHNKNNALILSFSLSNHLFYPFLYKYIPIWPRKRSFEGKYELLITISQLRAFQQKKQHARGGLTVFKPSINFLMQKASVDLVKDMRDWLKQVH